MIQALSGIFPFLSMGMILIHKCFFRKPFNLFSEEEKPLVLPRVAEEVAQHVA